MPTRAGRFYPIPPLLLPALISPAKLIDLALEVVINRDKHGQQLEGRGPFPSVAELVEPAASAYGSELAGAARARRYRARAGAPDGVR